MVKKVLEYLIGSYHVVGVERCAFANSEELTSVRLPESIESIEERAFAGCINLKSVNIPSRITTISERLFSGCSSLIIELSPDWTSIGNSAFQDCGFEEITIPDTWTESMLGTNAIFRDCRNLRTITFPASWETIPGGICLGCNSLDKIVFPTNLKNIGRYAFSSEDGLPGSLREIDLPETVETIEEGAFYAQGIRVVYIPQSVKVIGRNGFTNFHGEDIQVHIADLDRFLSIDMQSGSIGYHSLILNGTHLKHVDFPDSFLSTTVALSNSDIETIGLGKSITTIANSSFYGCRVLDSVTIPESVTSIGERAFYNCFSLKESVIPESVVSIGNEAFYGCRSIKELTFPASATELGTSILRGCSALESVTILGKMHAIPDEMFVTCSNLKSVTLPSGIEKIGVSAFSACSNLTNIEIPATVNEIGYAAFSQCSALEYIEIPEGVKQLNSNLFMWCFNLKSIKLPLSIETIRAQAFYECRKLINISVSAINPPVNYSSGIEKLSVEAMVVSVPSEAVEAYLADATWGKLLSGKSHINIVNADGGIVKFERVNDVSSSKEKVDGETTKSFAVEVPTVQSSLFAMPGSQIAIEIISDANCSVKGATYNGKDVTADAQMGRFVIEMPEDQATLEITYNGSGGKAEIFEDCRMEISISDGRIDFKNIDPDVAINIYDISGKCVYSGLAKAMTLNRGIYFVICGSRVIKIAI